MKPITPQEIMLWKSWPDPADQRKVMGNPLLRERLAQIEERQRDLVRHRIPELSYYNFFEFARTGDRLSYERPYFIRRSILVTHGLQCWLHKGEDPFYVEFLANIMWSVCDEYTWALPAHVHGGLEDEEYTVDLFAAETACCLAEILHYTPELPEIVKKRVRREIFRRVLTPFLTKEEPFPFEKMENNWCAVCGGGIGIAAIYLMKDGEGLSRVLNRVGQSMERFMNSFSEDGACLEGLSYWTYGMSFFVSYAELLLRRSGGEVDLLDSERVHQIAKFQQKCYFQGGRTLSFSDGSNKDHFHPGLTSFLRRYYRDISLPPNECMASYDDDSCYRWVTLFRDLIWSDREISIDPLEPLSVFPDAQWWILRDGEIGVAAKGGHNGEPHNHNDIGSFLIYRGGEELLADLGAGEYTREYFRDETRYQIFCNSSRGHSVPRVDGKEQMAGAEYRARDVRMDEKSFSLEMAGAYPEGMLRSLRRTITYEERGHLVLTDEIDFGGEFHEITECFISRQPFQYVNPKEIMLGSMRICASKGLSILVDEVRQKDHQGREEKVYAVLLSGRRRKNPVTYRVDFYF